MGIGDKLTWAYRTLFILMLIWLRYIEESITSWGILVVWAVFLYFIFYHPAWAYRLIAMLVLVLVRLFESVITIWGVYAIWAIAFYFIILNPLGISVSRLQGDQQAAGG